MKIPQYNPYEKGQPIFLIDLPKFLKDKQCSICGKFADAENGKLNVLHLAYDKYVCDECFIWCKKNLPYTWQKRIPSLAYDEDDIGELYIFNSKEDLLDHIYKSKPEDCDIYLDKQVLLDFEDENEAIDSICYVKYNQVYPFITAFIPRKAGLSTFDLFPDWKELYKNYKGEK